MKTRRMSLRTSGLKHTNEFESEAFKDLNEPSKDEPTSRDDSGHPAAQDEESHTSDGDVSDDAPDAVSFSKGREAALANIRNVMAVVREEKAQRKDRRRKIDQQYKLQKQSKIARLEQARLPDSILQNLPSKAKAQPKTTSKPDQEDEEEDENEGGDDVTNVDESDDEKDVNERVSSSDDESDKSDGEKSEQEGGDDDDFQFGGDDACDDFLPFDTSDGNTGCTVKAVTLKDNADMANSKDRALAFKQDRLYGAGVHRESSKALLARKSKSHYINSR